MSTHSDFHIDSSLDYSWPHRWKVVVTQFETGKVDRSWVAWRRDGWWLGGVKRAKARMLVALHDAETYVNRATGATNDDPA